MRAVVGLLGGIVVAGIALAEGASWSVAALGATDVACRGVYARAGEPRARAGQRLADRAALASVALAWSAVHTVYAFRYARLFSYVFRTVIVAITVSSVASLLGR